MKENQFSFFDKKTEKRLNRVIHGGLDPKGYRKDARPFAPRKWNHLVLKSEKAKGKWSLLAPYNKVWIKDHIYEMARWFHVQVGDYVNAGNHLHIKVRGTRHEQFKRFLRVITGRIAVHVTGAKKGNKVGRFWQGLAYTRILKSSFQELRLRFYFEANRIEVSEDVFARARFIDQFDSWLRKLRKNKYKEPPATLPAWA